MISCRTATLPELDEVLHWAADEGWNPGICDAAAFYAADPEGFFVAVDEADQPIAAISVVNHSDCFSFLGLYIVCPAYRGKGIGLALWQHAIAHAGDRTIGLDGVEAQQDNYVKSGFQHAGGTIRFTGRVTGAICPSIRFSTKDDIHILLQAEATASGVQKDRYMTAWLSGAEYRRTLVSDGPDGLNGFCTVRKCRTGAKIGPLCADTPDVAGQLIAHAATVYAGPVTLDVPESANTLAELCKDLGLEPGFKTARMYTAPINAPSVGIFAVTSLELG